MKDVLFMIYNIPISFDRRLSFIFFRNNLFWTINTRFYIDMKKSLIDTNIIKKKYIDMFVWLKYNLNFITVHFYEHDYIQQYDKYSILNFVFSKILKITINKLFK